MSDKVILCDRGDSIRTGGSSSSEGTKKTIKDKLGREQKQLLQAQKIDVMNRLGRAMADPTRSRILLELLDGPGHPSALARTLTLTRSNVSNHLACLRGCGIIVAIPEGRQTRYEIADAHLTKALSTLMDVVLAVDEGAPCADGTCTLPSCCAPLE
ncbi:MAG: ArsR family transcriptional regulator [Microbacteriaceae bacterium]|nr:ArsR family transcriptional regulator [Microbacteriaceae bacterium]